MNGSPRILFVHRLRSLSLSHGRACLLCIYSHWAQQGDYAQIPRETQQSEADLQSVIQGRGSTCDVLLGDLASALHTATKQTGPLASCLSFCTHEVKAWIKCSVKKSLAFYARAQITSHITGVWQLIARHVCDCQACSL